MSRCLFSTLLHARFTLTRIWHSASLRLGGKRRDGFRFRIYQQGPFDGVVEWHPRHCHKLSNEIRNLLSQIETDMPNFIQEVGALPSKYGWDYAVKAHYEARELRCVNYLRAEVSSNSTRHNPTTLRVYAFVGREIKDTEIIKVELLAFLDSLCLSREKDRQTALYFAATRLHAAMGIVCSKPEKGWL